MREGCCRGRGGREEATAEVGDGEGGDGEVGARDGQPASVVFVSSRASLAVLRSWEKGRKARH